MAQNSRQSVTAEIDLTIALSGNVGILASCAAGKGNVCFSLRLFYIISLKKASVLIGLFIFSSI